MKTSLKFATWWKRFWALSALRARRRLAEHLRRQRFLFESLESRVVLTANAIAEQFLVNETVALEESPAAVAVVESSGDFVAVWASFEQSGGDESGLGIYARRFSADGTPKDDAFLVNSAFTEGDQLAPDVAVDAAGNFLIVWESQGEDGDGAGIYAQRYLSDGTAAGVTFQVNDFTTGDQQAPSVAMDNSGQFVIAWQSAGQDGDGYGVYARRYASDGTALEMEEFLVNMTTDGDQKTPTVAAARGNGNFVIAWEGDVTAAEESVEIFARLYDSAGSTIRDQFQVNSEAVRDQVTPDAAMDTNGDFVVAWTSEGLPGSGSDVFAQRFDSAGMSAGGEFRVNETTLQGQRNPAVAMDGDGDFFVTWQSSHQDQFSWGIFGRAYDAAGNVLTTEQQVNTFAEQPQTSPAVAANSDGQTVAVWLGLDEDHTPAVHAQRLQLPHMAMDFGFVGDEIVLANLAELEDTSAAAAVDANRNFVVVWQSYGDDGDGLGIVARRFNATGAPLGDAFVVNTTAIANQSNPDVAMDSVGNFVVVWESADQDGDGHGIFAQRFDAAGNKIGGEIQVNTTVAGHQSQPSIAMNALTGDFAVVWQADDASGAGIYGQRFNAAGVMVGTEFQVNSQTYRDQVSPEISMNESGEFAVVWVSDHRAEFDEENDSEKSIFVQWYDAAGNSFGDEQLVHTIIKDFEAQEYPDVALDADGNFVVVWQSITQDGSAWGVYGRQFLADKTPVQPAEFQINQTTLENQRRATVVSDPSGNFTVSWQSDRQDQSATAVVSRQYNADGTPETDEMLVNTWELGPQILPVMAMTPSGDYGIFWVGQGNSRTEGIHGRIYEEGYVPPPPHLAIDFDADQILVSEAMGLEQSTPAVAVIESSGDYVAAWTSFEQTDGDESGQGIYAQRFFADGTPKGAAWLVNTAYTRDDQNAPAIATDAAGNFVVVWESLYQDGDGFGVYAQRYLADGTPDGGMFQVNVTTAGDQHAPTVAMDNDGNYVIAWQSSGQDGDGYGIYARRYNSAGVALDAQEFLVNESTDGDQISPTAARAREAGQFLIAWQGEVLSAEPDVEPNVEVFGRLYAANGSALSSEFQVNTISPRDQVGPHAAMNADGQFVVAWTSEGQMGSGADVFARRFDATGAGLGDDFRVNVTTAQGQQYPTVGIDADGNFIISWQSSHQDGFSWGIFAQVYDADGNVVADEFQVNSNTQGPQINPAINANSSGDAVVIWLGLDVTHQPAIHAQRFILPQPGMDFVIGPEGEIELNNYVALEEAPAASAVDASGNFIIVWQSYGEDGSGLGIYGRRFDSTGLPLGDAFLVTTTTDGNQSHPDVAADAAGNFVVTWQSIDQDGDGYGIFAQRFDANGDKIGPEFQVNTSIVGDQSMPSVAVDADDGSFVIVWQGPDADGQGIYGRRYNSLGNPIGDQFQINTFTDLDQVSPSVAMNATGEFVVGWVSDHRAVFDPTDTEKSIFLQWFNADGEASGDEVLAHSIQPEFEAQELPDVAIDENGNFVVVWQSINQDGNTWGVFGRQFLADKSAVQPIEFQINQTVLAPQRHASVALDPDGNFIVGWQSHMQDASGPGVFGRLFDAAAVAQSGELTLATWEQGPQTSPVIAIAPDQRFGIFWTGHGTDRAEGVHGRLGSIVEPSVVDIAATTTDGADTLLVTYEVIGAASEAFDILVHRSVDRLIDAGDTLLDIISITDAADLSVGVHSLEFKIGGGPDQVALPGAGAVEESNVYRLLFSADESVGQFSGVYHVSGGAVFVHGTDGDDDITLANGSLQLGFNGDVYSYDDSDVSDVRVRAHDGDDTLTTGADVAKSLFFKGGAGNDLAYGGAAFDFIYGGLGNDTLYGLGGNDFIRGSVDNDRIYGGDGDDTLYGHDGDDFIRGNAGNDVIYGENGNDVLSGSEDNDIVNGGDGNDTIYGNDGDDTLYGSTGNDYIRAVGGNGRIYGGDGDDSLYGSTGNDFIRGNAGNDHIYGDDGNDTLAGSEGDDFIRGNLGEDTIYGDLGNDTLLGSEGNDYIRGLDGDDLLYGEDGNDSLYGDDGRDSLFGMLGDDFLDGGLGIDLLDGGPGTNILVDPFES